MMIKKILWLIAVSVLTIAGKLRAQTTVAEKAVAEIRQVQELLGAANMAVEMKYTYAGEHTPGVVLDSLSGKVEMAGKNYRCVFNRTEIICNDQLQIILFGEDRLMYLAKAGAKSGPSDPIAMMQQMLSASGVENVDVVSKDARKTIRIKFAPSASCKEMMIVVDVAKKRLDLVQYVIKTTMLSETAETPEGYEEYAVVKAVFFNYAAAASPRSRFENSTYFRKDGGKYTPADAYKDYTIFLGSPDL